MLKLIKYLKRSIIPILAILALLVVQAMCDLALPDYTSVIVNVGTVSYTHLMGQKMELPKSRWTLWK